MELRQIQYFLQLYEDRNITKASGNLFISQQGLSKSISKLEQEMGIKLFTRGVQGVVPTEEAEKLHESFARVMQDYRGLQETADYLRGVSVLRVVAPEGYAMSCDKKEFMRFTHNNAEVDFQYEEMAHDDIPQALRMGRADLGYQMASYLDADLQRHCTVRREPLCAILSSRHPLSGRERLRFADLYGCNLLFLNDYQRTTKAICQQLEAGGLAYHRAMAKPVGSTYLHYIYDSDLIGFGLKGQYRYYRYPGIRYVPLCDEKGNMIQTEIVLVTMKQAGFRKEVEDYIESEKMKYKKLNK